MFYSEYLKFLKNKCNELKIDFNVLKDQFLKNSNIIENIYEDFIATSYYQYYFESNSSLLEKNILKCWNYYVKMYGHEFEGEELKTILKNCTNKRCVDIIYFALLTLKINDGFIDNDELNDLENTCNVKLKKSDIELLDKKLKEMAKNAIKFN